MSAVNRYPAGEELLLDYATGTLGPAGSLLVATHCAMVPGSRQAVSILEAVGGTMLDAIEPVAVANDGFEQLMQRLGDDPAPVRPAAPVTRRTESTVPAPLRALIGDSYEGLAWRSIGGDVAVFDLPVDDGARRAFLIKVPARRMIPMHTHGGQEWVLVLQGGLSDESGHFGPGDVEIADSSVTHQPIADAGVDCICLAVTDAPIKLTGPVGRVLNLFVRI